jgi:hypothetical protein
MSRFFLATEFPKRMMKRLPEVVVHRASGGFDWQAFSEEEIQGLRKMGV